MSSFFGMPASGDGAPCIGAAIRVRWAERRCQCDASSARWHSGKRCDPRRGRRRWAGRGQHRTGARRVRGVVARRRAVGSGHAPFSRLPGAIPSSRSRRRSPCALATSSDFGGGVTLQSLLNSLARQGDALIVGRLLGASALGLYNRAYEMMAMPAAFLTRTFSGVLFPVMSQVQGRDEMLRSGLYRVARHC